MGNCPTLTPFGLKRNYPKSPKKEKSKTTQGFLLAFGKFWEPGNGLPKVGKKMELRKVENQFGTWNKTYYP